MYLTIDYKGKKYHTNVITSRDTTEEEIAQMALTQIKKQWKL